MSTESSASVEGASQQYMVEEQKPEVQSSVVSEKSKRIQKSEKYRVYVNQYVNRLCFGYRVLHFRKLQLLQSLHDVLPKYAQDLKILS